MRHVWPTLLGFVLGIGALLYGLRSGVDFVQGCQLAARYTARVGFPLLIVAFTAHALARLWHNKLTANLMHNRRWWGLGFALSHTVHLFALLAYWKAKGESPPLYVIVGGGAAYVLMYAMAFTSTRGIQRRMGSAWKRLHKLGIYYLWLVFTQAFALRAVQGRELEFSVPFTLIALAALALRIAASRRAPSHG